MTKEDVNIKIAQNNKAIKQIDFAKLMIQKYTAQMKIAIEY